MLALLLAIQPETVMLDIVSLPVGDMHEKRAPDVLELANPRPQIRVGFLIVFHHNQPGRGQAEKIAEVVFRYDGV